MKGSLLSLQKKNSGIEKSDHKQYTAYNFQSTDSETVRELEL